MRTPFIFSADDIKTWNVQTQGCNGLWTQARPVSHTGMNIRRRCFAAWMVFTGRADVLIWLSDD